MEAKAAVITSLYFLMTAVPLFADPQADLSTTGLRNQALNVFTPTFGRDLPRFKTEITYVNYVNIQSDGDVVILFSRQTTGSGGQIINLTFTGQRAFRGMDDTVLVVYEPNETVASQQEKMVSGWKRGLVRYVNRTPFGSQQLITYAGPATGGPGGGAEMDEVDDPWNSWVFRINGNGNFNFQELSDSYSLATTLSVNRVTAEWISRASYRYSYSQTNRRRRNSDTGELDDLDPTTRFNSSADGNLIKTLGAHAGMGVALYFLSNTFQNYRSSVLIAPAYAYNVFPYSESSRRELTIHLISGIQIITYDDSTTFDKLENNLVAVRLDITFDRDESWGSMGGNLEYTTYLPFLDLRGGDVSALSLYSIEGSANLSFRLNNGISVTLRGGAARIKNELNIRKADLSDYEIAIGATQRSTGFRYNGSIGITYTFGSIFNNTVNTRLSGF